MDYIHGRSVIEKNNLIPRKISKKIINFINFDKNFLSQKDLKISKYITYDQLCEIRKKFQNFKKKEQVKKPRNFKIYEFINNINQINKIDYDEANEKLILPEFSGIKLSLSSILLSNYNLTYDQEASHKINFLSDFNKLMTRCNFKKTQTKNIENLFKLIRDVKKHNNTLYIVTPCCPDYSKERAGKRYNFTFNSIEDGIGLVAERLNENIKDIHNFFKSYEVKFKHIITIGDFEAYSKKNLFKLNLSKKVFLQKTKINQNKIKKKFKDKNCLTNKMFSEIFGNENTWNKNVKKFLIKIKKNQLGFSELDKKKIKDIIGSRISLYKKWYGNRTPEKYKEILFSQGAEYAAMGYLINKKYKNSIVIGADHHKMSQFYSIDSQIPVFYLKKNYIT